MASFDDYLAGKAATPQPATFDEYLAGRGTTPPAPRTIDDWAKLSSAPRQNIDAWAGAVSANPAGAVTQSERTLPNIGLATDLAAGGASPDTWRTLQQIGSGAWHGVSSLANNAANLVEKGVSAGVNAIPGVQGSAFGNWLASTADNDVAAQAAADRQFRETASPGEQASAIVAPMVLPMGGVARAGSAIRNGVTALPMMSGAVGRAVGGVLGNAATGAALSAGGASVDPSQPYWPQVGRNALVGGAVGAGVPAAIGAVSGAGRALYNVAQPVVNPRAYVGSGLANAVGDEAAQVAANIRGAQAFVPGSMPTTAQAAGNPVLTATEKAASNSYPDLKMALAQRAIENNDARWSALMGVAGTPADMQAAQAARDAAASPLYQQAHQATANVGPAFMRYAQIPEMQEAMQRANELASLDAAVGRGVAPVWPQQGGSNAINGAALDYTSRALGDMIGEAQRAGANTRAGALAALKGNVDNWMGRYIPGVQQARAAYAAGSVPVNTMQVGQQIANGLGTRAMNAGGVPEIGLMPYRSALAQAMNNGDAARYGIDANALGTLQSIGQDLQRATISNSVRTPGSDTAYNLSANGWLARNIYGPNFGGATGLGRAVGAIGAAATGHPMIGLGILGGGSRIGQMVGNRLNGQLSDLLLNPQGFLPYLDARAGGAAAARNQMLGQALARRLQSVPALVAPQLVAPSQP
ncbi:hypothetical protein [Paraburkholderia mimosarum]|uniref:hypothetical protein n=1 Tax=Paraburkholderia mimosarum TaxID=312026 RepID=UPI000419CBAB|nr:hypothetical protein [Paraburkholderia mimosarum]